MPTLLLRLQGPMQSWGTTSRFDERDTQLYPSKSGVLGLVCAALGRDRSEEIHDLAALKMGVRVDRAGVVMRDYQTATGVLLASGKPDLSRTVVSPRFYLADAVFLVGLEGNNFELLLRIDASLRAPKWPMALGRKAFVPSAPVCLPDALVDQPLFDALRSYPSLVEMNQGEAKQSLYVLENSSDGSVRMDQPIGPFSRRRFGPRLVQVISIESEAADAPDPNLA